MEYLQNYNQDIIPDIVVIYHCVLLGTNNRELCKQKITRTFGVYTFTK